MSRRFNGSSDRITPTFPRNTSQVSVCYSYKRNSASGRHFIIWAGATGAGQSNYYLYQSTTVVCLGWYNGGYNEQTFAHTADTNLHRICWVADWDADTIAAYFDGASQTVSLSGHTTTPSTSTGADRFGTLSDIGSDWANGDLAEVGVWTGHALSADHAIALTKGYSPLAVRRQNLAAYWPMFGNLSNEPDIVGGTTCSLTGTSKAAHPPMIYPRRRRLYLVSSGPASITGTASLQEANDTLSSAATIAITASAALQEANDTLVSLGIVAVTGTATIQEAADALTSDVTVAFPGATATAALAEANDTLISAASVVLTGAAALTEANDALTSSGAVSITASASLLEANDTLAAEGGTATFAIAAMTERDDALTATGTVLVTGTAAIAEAADVLASAATVSITAAAALQEANDLLTAAGSVGTVVRTADAALQEANDALAATAVSSISASAAIIEAGDIVVSGVTVLVTASAVLVEENDGLTSSGTAMFGVFADAALQEANDTLTSAVVQKIARRIAASDAGRWTITSSDGLN